jgi:5,10-methylenetetrahydrofolate reductase
MEMTLQAKLAAKRFVITAEVTPPVSFDRAELIAKAAPLQGLADAVNITDGAGARRYWCKKASSRSCNSPAATAIASRYRAT